MSASPKRAINAPHIGGGETEIDWISDPHRLVNAAPKFADYFDTLQDVKSMWEESRKISAAKTSVGMTQGGALMRVACFPHELYVAICEVNPFFLKNKREFYSWLERNPFYRTGRSVVR